ncbi:hypothetical protein ANO11243_095120 [Dothideomycetidae sp. 11243]|nr:hypothetical protein ANO11243_095120 [fungal sp. No.11243]
MVEDPESATERDLDSIPENHIIGTWVQQGLTDKHNVLYVDPQLEPTAPTDSPVLTIYTQTAAPLSSNVKKYAFDQSGCALFSGVNGPAAKPEVSVIISTESGAKQASQYYQKALKPVLEACGVQLAHKTYTTESEHTITQLAKDVFAPKAARGHEQTIILLSGDGGTIDLVNGLAECLSGVKHTPPTLIPLPLGSGNALSNSYKYNSDETVGLSTLLQGKRRQLPMFRATFSKGARLVVNEGEEERQVPVHDGQPSLFGVVVCSWGLHASLVADSDTAHYRQYGNARFGMVAKNLLFPSDGTPPHKYKGQVSFMDKTHARTVALDRGEHSYILATLVSNLEKTFCISPDSKALDGKLRLVEMPPMPSEEMHKVMMAGYEDGKHIGKENVGYHTIDQLEITFDEPDEKWRRVCVDGKIVKVERGGFLRLTTEEDGLVDIVCLE